MPVDPKLWWTGRCLVGIMRGTILVSNIHPYNPSQLLTIARELNPFTESGNEFSSGGILTSA